MLTRKQEPIGAHTAYAEDFTELVEFFEGDVKSIERILCHDVLTCNITEI